MIAWRHASTNRQRGFLLIIAVILIAVAATMAAVILALTASSGQSGAQHVNSTQALFVAESGLERGIDQWDANSAYAGETLTFGAGTAVITVADTDFSGAALTSSQKRIRSVGTVNSAVRTAEVIVNRGSNLASNGTFTGGATGWTLTPPSGQTFAYDATDGNPTTPAGSAWARRVSGSGTITFTATQTLASSITTTAASTVFTAIYDYRTDGNVQFIVRLIDSVGGVYNSTNNNLSSATWATGPSISITVPLSGTVITQVQIEMRMTGGADNARIDNVSLSGGGGGGSGVTRQSWQEVFP